MVEEVDKRTIDVFTVKVALVAPAGTVTLEGTPAAPLLLESRTCAPPAGAGPLSVTVPEDCPPPITFGGFSVSEDTVGRGGGFTVRVIVVVFSKLPDEPAIVTVTVPIVAALLVASVNVLVMVAGLGLNDAVTPLGRPEADKLTLPLKPFCGAIVTVLIPLVPCVMLRLLGAADKMKFGWGVSVSRAELVAPPKDAVIVTGVDTLTALVLTLNVALLAPAGTVTLEGTLAAAPLLESATCAPPAGAAPLMVTVPVEDCTPPITLVGFRVIEERESVGRSEGCSKIRTAGFGSLNGTATNFEGEMT